MTLLEKFQKKIVKGGLDDCWEWSGHRDVKGYGRIRLSRYKTDRAHRAAWMLYRGSIPSGLHVLHMCDNTSCANPNHLFLGTNSDNVVDRDSKNRGANLRGSAHGMSKMNEELVVKMRSDYSSGSFYLKDLAKKYNMSLSVVWTIVTRKTWVHVS